MIRVIFLLVAIGFISACQTTPGATKGHAYPHMYSQPVKSILVLPVANTTTDARAAEQFASTLSRPLAEAGFYVFSVPFVKQFFEQEGITDGAQLSDVDVTKYRELFGADAVLYVNLYSWDTQYLVLAGSVSVGARMHLVSTDSNTVIWQQSGMLSESTTNSSDSLLANIISTAINTATTDYMPIAEDLSRRMIMAMPYGRYHERYLVDHDDYALMQFPMEQESSDAGEFTGSAAIEITPNVKVDK